MPPQPHLRAAHGAIEHVQRDFGALSDEGLINARQELGLCGDRIGNKEHKWWGEHVWWGPRWSPRGDRQAAMCSANHGTDHDCILKTTVVCVQHAPG